MARSKHKYDKHSRANTLSHRQDSSDYDRLASSVVGMHIKDLIEDDYQSNNNDVDATSRYLTDSSLVMLIVMMGDH